MSIPPLQQPRFSCTTLSQTNSKERAWGALHTQKNTEIMHPTAVFPKLEMRLSGVTGEVAGLWENLSSFGEVISNSLDFVFPCVTPDQAGIVQLS